MGKRLVAILISVALVGGAYWFRTRPEPGQIICDPMIASQCRAVFGADVVVMAPHEVIAALIASEMEPSVWLTASVWADIANDRAINRSGQRPGDSAAVAFTPLVVVNRGDCVTHSCVATALADGSRVGIDDLASTPGALAAGALTNARFGGSVDAGRIDSGWFRRLEKAATGTAITPAYQVMVTRPGTYDLSVGTEAGWSSVVRSGFQADVATDPMVEIELVAIQIDGAPLPGMGALGDELAVAGWRSGPATTDAPVSPGVLWLLSNGGP